MTTEEENVVTSAVFEFLALAETPGGHFFSGENFVKHLAMHIR